VLVIFGFVECMKLCINHTRNAEDVDLAKFERMFHLSVHGSLRFYIDSKKIPRCSFGPFSIVNTASFPKGPGVLPLCMRLTLTSLHSGHATYSSCSPPVLTLR
jgi:hypothetical protein